jgi:hypothetical protein
MRGAWLGLVLGGCVTATPAPVTPPVVTPEVVHGPVDGRADEVQRTLVQRFVDAAEKHDFDTAWRLLAEPLRDRYTPERLKADFEAEPLAGERLSRIRRALDQSFRVEGRRAFLELTGGRVLELVQEPTGWRVAALE